MQRLEDLTTMEPMDDNLSPRDQALAKLGRYKAMREILADESDEIAKARLAGASWAQIGEATGYTRATVIKRAKDGNGGVLPDVGRVG